MSTKPTGPGLPYTGIQTFLGWPYDPMAANLSPGTVAAIGVPYDEGTPYAPGARFAPSEIRKMSMRLRFATEDGLTFVDAPQRRRVKIAAAGSDLGDVVIHPLDQQATFRSIEARVEEVAAAGAIPVVLGGDNAITYPAVKGLGQPVTLVQFDAHLDYGSGYFTQRHGNSTPMRQLVTDGHAHRIIHCGIRGLDNALEDFEVTEAAGNTVISSDDVRCGRAESLLATLDLQGAVYVSLDVDVLDPSVAPGTGYHEPGGITLPMLEPLFQAIARQTTLLGCEVVEVSPGFDVNSVTSLTAAQAIVSLLMAYASGPLAGGGTG